MSKSAKTSSVVARKASKTLSSPKSSKIIKAIAGSALAQKGTKKRTSAKVATSAAKTLDNPRSSKTAKALSGSVLSQKSSQARKTKHGMVKVTPKTLKIKDQAGSYKFTKSTDGSLTVTIHRNSNFPIKSFPILGSSLTKSERVLAIRKVATFSLRPVAAKKK